MLDSRQKHAGMTGGYLNVLLQNEIMAKERLTNPSQLINFMSDSYLDRTSRPIYALVYLLWFLVIYEVGSILISPDLLTESLSSQQIRVVSFIWLHNFVEFLGFPPRFTAMATPLLVVVILLALQITSRKPWKVYLHDFIPMTIECVFMSLPLIALSWLIIRSAATYYDHSSISMLSELLVRCTADGATVAGAEEVVKAPPQVLVDIVSGIGAGIYEELIFRLVLICLLMLILQDVLKFPKTHSIVISVLVSAALFSIHHNFFPLNGTIEMGEAFSPTKFIFRAMAGVYFAIIFALRGFGVAAGTHAFYDIIAALLNAAMVND